MYSQFVQQYQFDLKNIALAVKSLSMDAVLKSKSGHIGLPLGGAEIGTFIYFAILNQNPQNSKWIDRDRFILSAGHGSMLQYSLLHLAGYNLPLNEIINFRQLHSKTPGHPEYGHTDGVECTTGPLGQGLASAVGVCIAERMLAARFCLENTEKNHEKNILNHEIINHRTFVLAGDGCMMEGVTSEACSLAGHLKLNRLAVFYDANNITIDGTIDIAFTENVAKRFEAYGFNILHADGNSFESLASCMDKFNHYSNLPLGETGPTLIICKTIAGKGSPKWEGKPKIHGNPMSSEDVIETKKNLGLTNFEPFYIPQECLASAKKLIQIRTEKYFAWEKFWKETSEYWIKNEPEKIKLWNDLFHNNKNTEFNFTQLSQTQSKMATRIASGKALTEIALSNPKLVGGSADLAGSNLTTIPNSPFIHSKDFSGRNIHFGVREHGMAAICNGITLHGGFQAFCATFLVFSDYMRPAIRLAALMKIPTIFIFTHDSIGVGEDGPTHQPIEHADALRVIPQLNVLRPADALETFAAWKVAVDSLNTPSALLLTRQDVPNLDDLCSSPRNFETLTSQMQSGGILIQDFKVTKENSNKKLILISSGSEVQIALKAAQLLEKKSFNIRVISSPNPQTLVKNPVQLNHLIPKNILTFAIEASSGQSFGEIVGRNGAIFALNHFGTSAPFSDLTNYYKLNENYFCEFILNQMEDK